MMQQLRRIVGDGTAGYYAGLEVVITPKALMNLYDVGVYDGAISIAGTGHD